MFKEEFLPDRTILLYGEINEYTSKMVVGSLLAFNSESAHMPIVMYINSPGGALYSMWSILDMISTITSPLFTVGVGSVMSAAVPILAAGTPSWRFVSEHTRLMLHNVHGGTEGNPDSVQSDAKELEFQANQYIEALARYTKRPIKKIAEDIQKTNYMSPEQALVYGLADHIRVIAPSDIHTTPYVQLQDPLIGQPEKKKEKKNAIKDSSSKRSK